MLQGREGTQPTYFSEKRGFLQFYLLIECGLKKQVELTSLLLSDLNDNSKSQVRIVSFFAALNYQIASLTPQLHFYAA